MTVLQQYYTSYVNKETGSAGFQVKATSAGISSETEAMISRLIAYRIPANMDVRAIEEHPVALRYYYRNARECILLCSQSSGNDENGRPGNFFAHSVVMPPDSLTSQPPILYWRSPFWRKEATETTEIRPLVEFQAPQSPDIIDEMWTFLADESRQEAFYKLMCAVVQSTRINRRIIIIDTDSNVALWVAAVSCMLPPAYRPLLTFTTYHHDPYQSWFLITGTTDDSTFRGLPEESVSHFVLDGRTNATSHVAESKYANLVRGYTRRDNYEEHLLQYFLVHEKRFPKPTCIDEQLDVFVLYIRLVNQRKKKETSPIKTDVLQAITPVIARFEQLSHYNDEDVQDLAYLREVLENARKKSYHTESHSSAISSAYDRVVHLYQKHNIPTDEVLRGDLEHYTEMLLDEAAQNERKEAIDSLMHLRQTYGEREFVTFANKPGYLQYINNLTKNPYHQKLQLLWVHIGPFLRPGPDSQKLFLRSVSIWGDLLQDKRQTEAAKALFLALRRALEKRELDWLGLLLERDLSLPDLTLQRFYWNLCSPLSLEEREPYRAIVREVVPTIADDEFCYDVASSDLQTKVAVIGRWVVYTKKHTQIKDPASVVIEGLKYLKRNPSQWKMLIADLLMNDEIVPLLAQREDELVQEVLCDLRLQQFSQEHIELYKRYKDSPSLSTTSRDILAGMVAMSDGHLDGALAQRLYTYVSRLTQEMYYTEIHSFMTEFLKAAITKEDFALMISAFFVEGNGNIFYQSYWNTLIAMRIQLSTNEFEGLIRQLSLWFALSPDKFAQPDQCYALQQFFLTLRQQMSAIQKLSDATFLRVLDNTNSQAALYAAWYPLIQELLQVRKKSSVLRGPGWMKSMQKHLLGLKGDEKVHEQERELNREVDLLLQKGAVREQHIGRLAVLCTGSSRTQFWAAYEEKLIQVLTANDAEHMVEIFSFWFDESFKYVRQEPYIAQDFFIKLPEIFEAAHKEHEDNFRKTAQLFIAHCSKAVQQGQQYNWYLLIHPFLVRQQSMRRSKQLGRSTT